MSTRRRAIAVGGVLLAALAVAIPVAALEIKEGFRLEITEDGSSVLTMVQVGDDEALSQFGDIQEGITELSANGWEAKKVTSGGLRGFQVKAAFDSSARMQQRLQQQGIIGPPGLATFSEFSYSLGPESSTFRAVVLPDMPGRPSADGLIEVVMPGSIRSVSSPGSFSGNTATFETGYSETSYELAVVSDIGDFSLLSPLTLGIAAVVVLGAGALMWNRTRRRVVEPQVGGTTLASASSSRPQAPTEPPPLQSQEAALHRQATDIDGQPDPVVSAALPATGVPSRSFCGNCGERLIPDDRFCGKCGATVAS